MTKPSSGALEEEPLDAPKRSTWRALLDALSPKTVWSMSDGYPVVLKQFIQFCLIIVYPGWVLGILGCLAVYGLFCITVCPVLWFCSGRCGRG
ncbi:MAG: hypothetical protein PGN37_21135 [Mycobacterium kyogaense]|uniref:hypothetical protein n=1 Tax=Mycobacterium kyogaense TaxID=2212479 RepID=UPI002FFBA996